MWAALSGVTRYPQNEPDDRTGHCTDGLRHNVEIKPYLRTNERQNEENPDQDHHAVRLKRSKRGSENFRKQSHGDPSSVEWRDW
jgi:hypothetical protein